MKRKPILKHKATPADFPKPGAPPTCPVCGQVLAQPELYAMIKPYPLLIPEIIPVPPDHPRRTLPPYRFCPRYQFYWDISVDTTGCKEPKDEDAYCHSRSKDCLPCPINDLCVPLSTLRRLRKKFGPVKYYDFHGKEVKLERRMAKP